MYNIYNIIYIIYIIYNNIIIIYTNTKHKKYNRHATTNQIILSLVTEVKEKIKYLPEDGQRLTETC